MLQQGAHTVKVMVKYDKRETEQHVWGFNMDNEMKMDVLNKV